MIDVQDILRRINHVLDGRSLFSLREQLLDDCRDAIIDLRKKRRDDLEKAAKIVEGVDVGAKTIVGKMQAEQRKANAAAMIRQLKDET